MDPTYPLFPIASLLSAVFLILVLVACSIRHAWNFGLCVLCFWMAAESITFCVNTIVWADSAEVKAVVWCDIATHVRFYSFIVRPSCSLIITRRLYKISKLRLGPPSKSEKRKDLLVDVSLGIVLPTLYTGIFYYIVQDYRFIVIEGFGCQNTIWPSGVSVILIDALPVIFPLISAVFYCPKILWTFYRHSREMNRYLNSNRDITRSKYLRILAIGCFDILITLPIGIMGLVTDIEYADFVFYPGWGPIHTDWAPFSFTEFYWRQEGFWGAFNEYFSMWSHILFSFVIFGVFGLSKEAREAYCTAFFTAARWVGWKRSSGGGTHTSSFAPDLSQSADIEASHHARDTSDMPNEPYPGKLERAGKEETVPSRSAFGPLTLDTMSIDITDINSTEGHIHLRDAETDVDEDGETLRASSESGTDYTFTAPASLGIEHADEPLVGAAESAV